MNAHENRLKSVCFLSCFLAVKQTSIAAMTTEFGFALVLTMRSSERDTSLLSAGRNEFTERIPYTGVHLSGGCPQICGARATKAYIQISVYQFSNGMSVTSC